MITNRHPDWATKIYLTLIGAIFINCLMNYLRSYILTTWQKKLTLSDSTNFFWHLIRLPIQFFQQRHSAEVASRITFNESVAGVLSNSTATAVLDFFVALFYLLLLFQYFVPLTLIGVSFSLVNLALLALTRRKLTDLTMRLQQDKGKEYGTLMNGLLMIESVKANGGEAAFFTKLAGVKGGDVTFNQNGSITLTEQSPITVGQSSADDKLNITTQGNTFISGTNDTKFNVNTPINAGDGKVVLMTGNGIDADKGITAKDIELYAGAGDLNAKLTPKTETVEKPTGRANTTITYIARNVDEYD